MPKKRSPAVLSTSRRHGGSVFTHYFVSGLMGAADANGDGRVSLSEVYRYAYEGTVRASSRTLAGAQHPTFQFQLRGQGDVALTFPGEWSARRRVLAFPADRTYFLMRGGADGPIVAEVSTVDGPRRLSVAPGTYFVRTRLERALLEGIVNAGAERVTAIDETQLERIEYARLARKGPLGGGRAVDVNVGYRWRSALWHGARACQGVFAGAAFATAVLTVSPRLGFCAGGFSNERIEARADEADAAVAVAHAWDLRRLSLSIAVEAGGALLLERFDSRGIAPPRTSAAGHLGVGGGVDADLPRGFHLLAGIGVHTYLFRQQDGGDRPAFTAAPALRADIGVGRYW